MISVAAGFAFFIALALPATAASPNPCAFDQGGNPLSVPCQLTMHAQVVQMDITAIPCPPPQPPVPGGSLTGTFNGVMHININSAGDFWVTNTVAGTFTLVTQPQPPAAPVTFTGHLATWFGISDNNRNGVDDFIANIQATGSDGTVITFHETMHISFTPAGFPTVAQVVFDKVAC